jgi:hypothetical protein
MKSREVVVNVVSCKQVERKGVRKQLMCEWVTEKVPVVETYCETVPYKTTVRVAVPAPVVTCAAPCAPMCAPPCETGCGGRRHRLCGR